MLHGTPTSQDSPRYASPRYALAPHRFQSDRALGAGAKSASTALARAPGSGVQPSVGAGDEPLLDTIRLVDAAPHVDMFQLLAAMWDAGELCDVTVLVDDQRFRCHRVVLASSSRYFRKLFSSGMRDATQEEIRLEDVDADVFAEMLAWTYRGDVVLRHVELPAILQLSSRLEVSSLVAKCIELFSNDLSPDSAIVTYELAHAHGIHELAERAREMMCRRFSAVSAHESFVDMPEGLLLDLVGADSLRAKEHLVLEAVLRWVRADEDLRVPALERLLPLVRFPLMSVRFISDVVYADHLVTSQPCWDKLALEAYRFQTTTATGAAAARVQTPRALARSGCAELYAVGGQVGLRGEMNQGRVEGTVTRYCPERGSWEPVPSMLTPRSKAGLAEVRGTLYCAGGSLRDGAVSSVLESYCPVRNAWETLKHMSIPRSGVGVAALEDKVYAVGGTDGIESALASAERFCPGTGAWEHIPPMSTSRLYAGVAVLDGMMYAVGGWEGTVDRAVKTVERFCPKRNAWEAVAPMVSARSAAGVAVLGDELYAVGGGDGASRWRTVERFSPRRGVWERVASMSTARSNLGVAVLDGMLYAVGGWDGSLDFKSAERYDPQRDEWERLEDLAEGRRGLRCCVAPSVQ